MVSSYIKPLMTFHTINVIYPTIIYDLTEVHTSLGRQLNSIIIGRAVACVSMVDEIKNYTHINA